MVREVEMGIFIARSTRAPVAAAKFVVMDWTTEGKGIDANGDLITSDDGQGTDWFTTGVGVVDEHYNDAHIKNDVNGSSQISLATGAGTNGSNALLIEDPRTDDTERIPEAWICYPLKQGNGFKANAGGSGRYLLRDAASPVVANGPPDVDYNRLCVRFKVSDGLFATLASKYSESDMFHLGTYNVDYESGAAGESHNFHFYHQFMTRTDLAEDGHWYVAKFNATPDNQRSHGGSVPWNPTQRLGHGNAAEMYHPLLTRLYLAASNRTRNKDPQIPGPIRIWIDEVWFETDPEPENPITWEFISGDYGDGLIFQYTAGTTHSFVIRGTNTSSDSFTGHLSYQYDNTNQFEVSVEVDMSSLPFNGGEVTWNGSESKDFTVSVQIDAAFTAGRYAGLTCCPASHYDDDGSTHGTKSESDQYIERNREIKDKHSGRLDGDSNGIAVFYFS